MDWVDRGSSLISVLIHSIKPSLLLAFVSAGFGLCISRVGLGHCLNDAGWPLRPYSN